MHIDNEYIGLIIGIAIFGPLLYFFTVVTPRWGKLAKKEEERWSKRPFTSAVNENGESLIIIRDNAPTPPSPI